MHSRARRCVGSSAAGLQRVMNSKQLASRRKMQARAMSMGRGSAASVLLPGVTGAVRKARGLGPCVLMAPATGRGQELRGKSVEPRGWKGKGTLVVAGGC